MKALRPVARGLAWILLAAVVVLGVGCRAFRPPEVVVPEALEGEVRLGVGYIERKQTLEIEGELVDGRIRAQRIEIEEEDDEIVLKGSLERLDEATGTVGGVDFLLDGKTRLVDTEGTPRAIDAFVPSVWVKVECIERDEGLVARKVTLRERKPEERGELQGRVSRVDHREGNLVIGGVPVEFPPSVLVVWDRDDADPPPPEERLGEQVYQQVGGVRRVRRVDEDDQRPQNQLVIGDILTIGGEIQYELEWRNNHNLRDFRDRDRLVHEPSTTLEFSLDLGRHIFAFFELRGSQDIIHFDEGADRDSKHRGRIGAGWVLLEDLPLPGIALQVGRQDIDHGREWVIDDEQDAVRLWGNLDVALLELWIGTTLFDSSPEEEGVTNFSAGLHFEPFEDTNASLTLLHRKGGGFLDLARSHLTLSLDGEIDDLAWWFDGGVVWGRESGQRVAGFGFDVLGSWTFSDLAIKPTIYAGVAFGSGDDNPGGTDGSFRQTGLNDNNDPLSSVTSFRYLGELVRPELSNIWVLTAGVGLRPSRRTSFSLLFHHYRQVESSTILRDTRLRLDPSGESKDLGNGIDLVIGLEDWRPLEIEVVLGWFHPGAAFPGADDAWFATLQVEWNF